MFAKITFKSSEPVQDPDVRRAGPGGRGRLRGGGREFPGAPGGLRAELQLPLRRARRPADQDLPPKHRHVRPHQGRPQEAEEGGGEGEETEGTYDSKTSPPPKKTPANANTGSQSGRVIPGEGAEAGAAEAAEEPEEEGDHGQAAAAAGADRQRAAGLQSGRPGRRL